VARRRARAAARDGPGGPGAAAGPSGRGNERRARDPDGDAAARPRSLAGGRASSAHAALRPAGPAGRGAQAIPGVRGRAAAGAWNRARGGDEATLSGAVAAACGGSQDGRNGSEPARSGAHACRDCTESPHRRDSAVRAAGGSGAPASVVGRGQARARPRRQRGGRGGDRQDAARLHARGGRAWAGLPRVDRPLPRKRFDSSLRALGRRLPHRTPGALRRRRRGRWSSTCSGTTCGTAAARRGYAVSCR
jgi:hypothetical protein